ncbi:MAG: hypothetical protein ABI776_07400 [Nocardioidaceae bacterium]
MSFSSTRPVLTMGALAVGALALSAQPVQATTPVGTLSMRAAGATGTVVADARQFSVIGDTSSDVAVAQVDGGTASLVRGPDADLPRAVRFPEYDPDGGYPRAVVSVTPTAGTALSPGDSDFEYGAVYRLDAVSSGRSEDNGDNVWQRGRYGDPAIFKLQLDHGYPSCLVKGSDGEVFARSRARLTPDTWYTTTCSRVGTTLTVAVRPYDDPAAVTTSVAVTGTSGTLTFAPTRPASIGGKLTSNGTSVARSADQLNGAVARVWVDRL